MNSIPLRDFPQLIAKLTKLKYHSDNTDINPTRKAIVREHFEWSLQEIKDTGVSRYEAWNMFNR